MKVTRTNHKNAIEGVYLFHFDEKYGHALHYAGYGKDVHRRIQAQACGKRTAANLIKVVHRAGINIRLARVWLYKTRRFERQIKDTHNLKRFCPICQGKIVAPLDVDFYPDREGNQCLGTPMNYSTMTIR